MTLRTLAFAALVFLVAAAVALEARAASMEVHGWTLGEAVEVRSVALTGRVYTAELSTSVDNVLGTSFCIDLAQHIGVGDYLVDAALVEDVHGNLEAAYLMETFGDGVPGSGRRTVITALQLAIWETTHESSDGPYSLDMGTFALVSASDEARELAEEMLRSIPSGLDPADYAHFVVAQTPTHQDQLWRPNTPVPEPNSALLLGAGAFLLALALRGECPTR